MGRRHAKYADMPPCDPLAPILGETMSIRFRSPFLLCEFQGTEHDGCI
jgi:hypothetical protein